MKPPGKLRALLATMRVANLPSVVSNVWVGASIGIAGLASRVDGLSAAGIPWGRVASLSIAACLIYSGGCFLNDWKDRAWDAEHRKERALPRGVFAPAFYLFLAIGAVVAGLVLAARCDPYAVVPALGIVAGIGIYTWYHKRASWTVVPMGLCRALLPVMGALGVAGCSSCSGGLLLLPSIAGCGLFFYVVGLSLRARHEALPERAHGRDPSAVILSVAVLVVLAPLVVLSLVWGRPVGLPLLSPLPLVAWLGFCGSRMRRPISRYVGGLLAGIPLLDWIMLMPVALGTLAMHTPRTHADDPLAVAMLGVPPVAFVAGLLLQRLAPAT